MGLILERRLTLIDTRGSLALALRGAAARRPAARRAVSLLGCLRFVMFFETLQLVQL